MQCSVYWVNTNNILKDAKRRINNETKVRQFLLLSTYNLCVSKMLLDCNMSTTIKKIHINKILSKITGRNISVAVYTLLHLIVEIYCFKHKPGCSVYFKFEVAYCLMKFTLNTLLHNESLNRDKQQKITRNIIQRAGSRL